MAQIELRDATIRLKDGTVGSAVVAANTTNNGSSVTINTVNMTRAVNAGVVPIGARFTVNTLNNTTTYVVMDRTPASNMNTPVNTPSINISGVWGANFPLVNDVITFKSQQIDIKIGEGNLTYTEHRDMKYTLDRQNLDTVREGDQKPVDVKTDFLYEFVTTGTNEDITPVDALKQMNGAAEWVSSSADQCEPFSVDVEVQHVPPCISAEDEFTLLPTFRYETLEFNLKDATISVTGKCNVVEASVTRV